MGYDKPVVELIKARYSCRSYRKEPLGDSEINMLENFLSKHADPPFGTRIRFSLVAASESDSENLKGLGTYGVIKNPAAFVIGAMNRSVRDLEDYGYLMEKNILKVADVGLGGCWLGGSFKRSSFAKRVGATNGEEVPAVASVGHSAEKKTAIDAVFRYTAGARMRKSWEELFFHGDFSIPLTKENAGDYAEVLEMLRIAPSASNRQPWRVVKEKGTKIFHLYLCRSKAYGMGMKLVGMADLQRVDMGIAMSHFELTAREAGLRGRWDATVPHIEKTGKGFEYIVTWIGQ